MANGTPNPNPRATVWGILGVALFIVIFVGWLAMSTVSQGVLHLTSAGGSVPATFVVVAVIVGGACVCLFIHRGHKAHK